MNLDKSQFRKLFFGLLRRRPAPSHAEDEQIPKDPRSVINPLDRDDRTTVVHRGGAPVVFLFEDNPADIYLVRLALQQAELACQLFVAQDGHHASTLLRHAGLDVPVPDLALVDLNLPQMHGYGLVRLLHSQPACQPARVVIITSSDAPADRETAARLGVTQYFQKPNDPDEFLQLGFIVRKTLRENRTAG